jgi:hypothetical protein
MARDYKKEYQNYQGKPEQIANRSDRNKARRVMEKKVGSAALKGKDVDHKKRLMAGGSNSVSNLRLQSPSVNRSRNGR